MEPWEKPLDHMRRTFAVDARVPTVRYGTVPCARKHGRPPRARRRCGGDCAADARQGLCARGGAAHARGRYGGRRAVPLPGFPHGAPADAGVVARRRLFAGARRAGRAPLAAVGAGEGRAGAALRGRDSAGRRLPAAVDLQRPGHAGVAQPADPHRQARTLPPLGAVRGPGDVEGAPEGAGRRAARGPARQALPRSVRQRDLCGGGPDGQNGRGQRLEDPVPADGRQGRQGKQGTLAGAGGPAGRHARGLQCLFLHPHARNQLGAPPWLLQRFPPIPPGDGRSRAGPGDAHRRRQAISLAGGRRRPLRRYVHPRGRESLHQAADRALPRRRAAARDRGRGGDQDDGLDRGQPPAAREDQGQAVGRAMLLRGSRGPIWEGSARSDGV